MKTTVKLFAAGLLLAGVRSTLAEVRYVDMNSTNATPPYTNWATAATNIQSAVDAAVAGDEIVVSNGIYATGGRATSADSTTNRLVADRKLSLRSVNGPQCTVIDGGGVFRCVYLTSGARLSGFTLTNGRAHYGGGLWCESTNAVVSNCVVSGNSALAQIQGRCCIRSAIAGGVYGGTLNNCILSDNWAQGYIYCGPICDLTTCNPVNGFYGCSYFPGSGGGAAWSILNNCTLIGNSAGHGGGAYGSTLNNSTLAYNSATGWGGGISAGTLNNCIVCFNTAPQEANYDSSSTLNYCCTAPLPTNGVGNITNEPAFVSSATGNYRLRPDSPCIDAGTNLSAIITNDLDGRPRPLDGNGDGLAVFDMGAYEYLPPLLVWKDSPNPTPPYISWATAATNIQDAVDAAVAGGDIVVTNGIYATGRRTVDGFTTNRVVVDKPLMLRSVNGPQFTVIDGGQTVRCVYLADGASLIGFTLTNGGGTNVIAGGGVCCHSVTASVSNCVMVGNSAQYGDFGFGGGAADGTLNNCWLIGNSAKFGRGSYSGIRNNCIFTDNQASAGSGGGSFIGILNNCTLTGNSAADYGGGAYGGLLNNCTIAGNSAVYSGGGVAGDWDSGGCTLKNCVVYFNTAAQGANHNYASTFKYSCTTPQPITGLGNITNAPLFVDQASGNLRLQSNSPCVNAGLNVLAPAGPDIDGNERIRGVTVDIGAYEFQNPASKISYAWLQQFNLLINPSTDTADPDGDGVNNYHEWLAGSDPSNLFSFPPLLTLIPYGVPPSGIILTWSTNAVGFTLQSTTNLGSLAVWSTNSPGPVVIAGQNTVTNPITGPQQFYRLLQ